MSRGNRCDNHPDRPLADDAGGLCDECIWAEVEEERYRDWWG